MKQKTSKRAIFFRVGAVVFLLVIAGIMMVIGRGHTVYLDNASLDYNGTTYAAAYKVVVSVDGEQVAKLYDKKRENRGAATCIGQKITMTLEITPEKGGTEETTTVTLPVPYKLDNIAVNLPAFLAGLPAEVYLSKFEPMVQEEEEAPAEVPDDGSMLMGDI
ncbi:MAG: DUF6672 family protein [Oscillibacter sp.]